MDSVETVQMQVAHLIPLQDQADHSSIFNFVGAISAEFGEWLSVQVDGLKPGLQMDLAIGPPSEICCSFSAVDERVDLPSLASRIHGMKRPRVVGMVAVSFKFYWHTEQERPEAQDTPDDTSPLDAAAGNDAGSVDLASVMPDRIPFTPVLSAADLEDPQLLKGKLYELIAQHNAEYQPPFCEPPVSPWYSKLFGKKQSAKRELAEPLPFSPPTEWMDEEACSEALLLELDDLRQKATESDEPMLDYVLAIRLQDEQSEDDRAESLQQLDKCIERFPNAPHLHYLRSEWSLDASQTENALRHSEKVIELAPKWPAGYYIRARVYIVLEAWDQAAADFSRITELHPTKTDAWLGLAKILAHKEQFDAALEPVNEALKCDPYSPDGLAMRMEFCRYSSQAVDAPEATMQRIDDDLNTALKYGPPHPYFLNQQAERSLRSNEPLSTIAICDETLSLKADDVTALGLRGVAYLSTEDVNQALLDLNRSIELGNESPAILEARGRIYLHNGDWELSRLDCERAIAVDDQFLLAYTTLANALGAMDEKEKALEVMEKIAELAPDWDQSHRALGDFYLRDGDLNAAFDHFNKAIDCDPTEAINWLQRGVCEAGRENKVEAISDAAKAIELDNDFAAAYRFRASIYLSRHDIDSALPDLTEVIRLMPDDLVSLFQRAQCYMSKNRPEDARADFDRVIELSPSLAAAYSGRARTWIESGDEERAAEDFHKATMEDPLSANDFEISRILAEAAMLVRDENFDAAIRKSHEAMEIDEDSEQARSLRATCYWHDEQFVEAIEDYTWLLGKIPEDDGSKFKRLACLNNRGHVYVEMGEFENGLKDLDLAVQLADEFGNKECQAYSHSARALAYAGLDQLKEARTDFELSVDMRPENAWVYYNQGLVYDKLDRKKDAAVCFDLALSLEEPPLTPRKRERAKAYVERHGDDLPPTSVN